MSEILRRGWLPVTQGQWAGWLINRDEPFRNLAGPYYARREEKGSRLSCAFRVEPRHTNRFGFLHEGALLAFVDCALFAIASEEMGDGGGVTLTFNSDFVELVPCGALVECKGDATSLNGGVVQISATVRADEKPVMRLKGIIKRRNNRGTSI